MLDVRLPIGALFFILGVMITAWGYTHPPMGAIASKMGPLPINFDIVWGIFMTLFGVAMFSVAKLDEAVAMERLLTEENAKASAEAVENIKMAETSGESAKETKVEQG